MHAMSFAFSFDKELDFLADSSSVWNKNRCFIDHL